MIRVREQSDHKISGNQDSVFPYVWDDEATQRHVLWGRQGCLSLANNAQNKEDETIMAPDEG